MDLLEEAEALQEKMTCEDVPDAPGEEGNEALTDQDVPGNEPDEIGEICEDRKLDPDSEKDEPPETDSAGSEPIRSSSGGNLVPSTSQCSVPSQEPVGCSQASQDRQAEVSDETPDGEDETATSCATESPAVGKDLVAAGGGLGFTKIYRHLYLYRHLKNFLFFCVPNL